MAARLVTFVVVFSAGLLNLFIDWRMTLERAQRIRPYWHLMGPVWYLPFSLARLIASLISLSLCGFAAAVLFGHVL
jgi:hypothetical protein